MRCFQDSRLVDITTEGDQVVGFAGVVFGPSAQPHAGQSQLVGLTSQLVVSTSGYKYSQRHVSMALVVTHHGCLGLLGCAKVGCGWGSTLRERPLVEKWLYRAGKPPSNRATVAHAVKLITIKSRPRHDCHPIRFRRPSSWDRDALGPNGLHVRLIEPPSGVLITRFQMIDCTQMVLEFTSPEQSSKWKDGAQL